MTCALPIRPDRLDAVDHRLDLVGRRLLFHHDHHGVPFYLEISLSASGWPNWSAGCEGRPGARAGCAARRGAFPGRLAKSPIGTPAHAWGGAREHGCWRELRHATYVCSTYRRFREEV